MPQLYFEDRALVVEPSRDRDDQRRDRPNRMGDDRRVMVKSDWICNIVRYFLSVDDVMGLLMM